VLQTLVLGKIRCAFLNLIFDKWYNTESLLDPLLGVQFKNQFKLFRKFNVKPQSREDAEKTDIHNLGFAEFAEFGLGDEE
jgi:hypothetical protein